MTVDEFLSWYERDRSDARYELIAGQPVAMAPPSVAHGVLISALTIRLGASLKPPCRVVGEAGIRLADHNDQWFQADLAVTCRPLAGASRWVPEPVVIVEVLSPSTAGRDREIKLDAYRMIPSVAEILLLDSTRRWAQMWRRDGADGRRWIVEDRVGDGVLRFESLGTEVALGPLYDGLD